jgi:hypothetical protein
VTASDQSGSRHRSRSRSWRSMGSSSRINVDLGPWWSSVLTTKVVELLGWRHGSGSGGELDNLVSAGLGGEDWMVVDGVQFLSRR